MIINCAALKEREEVMMMKDVEDDQKIGLPTQHKRY
jgi:hypothetical protein